jgi:DNA-binding transcriptional LysR family regulator
VELTQLRYFVAVAEELNFRRAAERCRVAQPALSRRVRRLEEELGVLLLHRTKREVRLTEAGEVFLQAAREGLGRIDAGAREVRRPSDAAGILTVGAVDYANFRFLPWVMRAFGERRPEARVLRRDLPPAEQVEALREGKLDVGFFGARAREKDLAYLPVAHASWSVALPAGHRLADTPDVILAKDLAGEPLVLFPRYANPELYDWTVGRLREAGGAGAEPRIVQEPTQIAGALDLVAAGLGLLPTPFFLSQAPPKVAVRRLAGFDVGVEVCAVHRKKDASVLLQDFLGAVREATARLSQTGQ